MATPTSRLLKVNIAEVCPSIKIADHKKESLFWGKENPKTNNPWWSVIDRCYVLFFRQRYEKAKNQHN